MINHYLRELFSVFLVTSTQGKYGRCLYYDHVTKCLVSKFVIQAAMYKAVHRYLHDTFRDKAFCHMTTIQAVTILALCLGFGFFCVETDSDEMTWQL